MKLGTIRGITTTQENGTADIISRHLQVLILILMYGNETVPILKIISNRQKAQT
jgi:hypothetical protein